MARATSFCILPIQLEIFRQEETEFSEGGRVQIMFTWKLTRVVGRGMAVPPLFARPVIQWSRPEIDR